MTLLAAALDYATRGWYVFPCRPGAKMPLTARGHLEASVNPDQINMWWGMHPNANIGVAVAPSGLVVLDVDTAEGKPGLASLGEINAHLPETLLARTGRGGYHGVFLRPEDMPAQRRIGFRPGLDLLGDGYFVAAPSVLTGGAMYRWERLMPPAPLPSILRDIAAAPKVQAKVEVIGAPIITGSRNNSLFRLGCALRDTGIGAEALARALDAENKLRFQPPVDDFELATIVNSVLNTVQVRRDVAADAIVEQEILDIFAQPAPEPPKPRASWIEDESLIDVPPTEFFSSGVPELDEKLGGGYATTQVTGIIAPPSAGKSSFVGHTLLTLQKQRPVLHCSLELMRRELVIRYASNKMERAWRDGMKGLFDKPQLISVLKGVRIKLMGCEDLDADDPLATIEAEARAMKAQFGVAPFIAVDYVQLLARGTEDKKNAVGTLTKRLRIMAQQLDTVIIAVFSTGRGFYSIAALEKIRAANDPTAYLGAAKESGDVEFDCANIFFLDVDKTHVGQPKPTRLAVARSRYGDIGFVGLHARLDIGQWHGAPEALQAFDTETRKAKLAEDTLAADCQKILATIDAMPNQAIGQMHATSKLSGARWRDAREHLEKTGQIREDKDVRKDGHKVTRARTLVRRNAASPTSVPDESDES
jgi:hypothetical protein